MDRAGRAFRLLRASWQVLKLDRELILLPVLSALLTLAVAASFFVAASGTGLGEDGEPQAVPYLLIAAFYFCAYFLSTFFNAAVVAAAMMRLNGEDPTVRGGLRAAARKLGPIAAWAANGATVGLVLRALEERAGLLGRFVIAVAGAAWSAITFFVVPVILFERLGAADAVRRSAGLFRQRWGETLVGVVGIGLAVFFLAVPVVLLAIVLAWVSVEAAVALGMLGVGGLAAVGATMSGIFNAALYRFATTGQAPGPFAAEDLQASFRERRRGLFG